MQCPECRFDNPDRAKVCNECGGKLQSRFETEDTAAAFKSPPHQSSEKSQFNNVGRFVDEHKHVTVLFSDRTGYTALSVKLGPASVTYISLI